MKPTRFLTITLVLVGLVSMLNAAGTPANTEITNQALGSYKDANGNEIAGATAGYVESNIVTTTVSQVAGASLGADQALNITALGSGLFSVTFTNTGNGSDTFALAATIGTGQTGSYTYQIYSDGGTLGVIDGSDAVVSSTGVVLADGTYKLLIKVTDTTSGGAPEADGLVVTLTATSGFNGSISDATVLTTTVQAATVTATMTPDILLPVPGDVITYAICITNSGSATAYDMVFEFVIPTNLTYSSGTIRTGTTGWDLGTGLTDDGPDADGGDWNATTTGAITVLLGDIAGSGNICVYYKVSVDAGVPEGTTISGTPTIDFNNIGAIPYPTVDPTGDITFDVAEDFGVDLASTGTTTFTGDPSDSLFYSFTVQNLGNGTDNFDLTDVSSYVVWTFYVDNGSGILSDAEIVAGAITSTGNLTQLQIGTYIAVGIIPPGTADGTADATTFTAESQGEPGTLDTDNASATCTAPVLTLVKTVTHGGTSYGTGDANSAAPGTVLTYTVVVANSGSGVASTVVVSDVIPANTTYVAESMTVDGSGDDDDNVVTSPETVDSAYKAASSVVFDFATMSAAGGATDSHILTFDVTIVAAP
ncbi:MAG: DUF11 domain-containing protein [Candidatus Marinimicrobia bacterium]|nr:DUF11 domain-containing protein [Candidatus Neomarinimicrobiota bacterium]